VLSTIVQLTKHNHLDYGYGQGIGIRENCGNVAGFFLLYTRVIRSEERVVAKGTDLRNQNVLSESVYSEIMPMVASQVSSK
jgi:hypothetical protein